MNVGDVQIRLQSRKIRARRSAAHLSVLATDRPALPSPSYEMLTTPFAAACSVHAREAGTDRRVLEHVNREAGLGAVIATLAILSHFGHERYC